MTENKEVKSNKKTANKRKVIDTNFVAPDGGWGWFVVVAAGCSNVSAMMSFYLYYTRKQIVHSSCQYLNIMSSTECKCI